jgi:hypothetical protein
MTSVHAQPTCIVSYKVGSTGSISPGSTFTVTNNFTNSGTLAIQVTGITLTVDFGIFSESSGLPLSVPAGTTQSSTFDVQVPSSASVGDHAASFSASLQCYESGSWVTPSFSPLVLSTTLPVSPSPTTLAAIGLIIIGVIVALVVVVVVLVVMLRRRKKAAPPPAPAYMPPPPPPPSPPPTG